MSRYRRIILGRCVKVRENQGRCVKVKENQVGVSRYQNILGRCVKVPENHTR